VAFGFYLILVLSFIWPYSFYQGKSCIPCRGDKTGWAWQALGSARHLC